jgi:hypothetical protein
MSITRAQLRSFKDSGRLVDIGYRMLWDAKELSWVAVTLLD